METEIQNTMALGRGEKHLFFPQGHDPTPKTQ